MRGTACRLCGDLVVDVGPIPPRVLRRHRDPAATAIGELDGRRTVLSARRVEFGHVRDPSPPNQGRPKTRGDCAGGFRPCPWVACKFHLLLDVEPRTGAITTPFDGADIDEIPETCALDVADRGGLTLKEVGEITALTRERVRQIEVMATRRARSLPAATVRGVKDLLEDCDRVVGGEP